MLLIEASTPREFARFLQYGRVGDTALYHVGFLALDKAISTARRPCGELSALQRAVWSARQSLHLTQKRLGAYSYEYRATVRGDEPVRERAFDAEGVRGQGA
jgi:hypothetical protein